MNKNIASPESVFALGGNLVSEMGALGLSQDRVDSVKSRHDLIFWSEFSNIARGIYAPPVNIPDELILRLGEWRSFYWRIFGIKLNVKSLRIPKRVEGIDYPVIVTEGVSINLVVKAHKERKIPFWQWCRGDLESAMQESERGPVTQNRVVWVHGVQEATDASEDLLKELPATIIAERKIGTVDLLERLIFDLFYHEETGRHLDEKSVTLCASSRYADGTVPRVRRDVDGKVCVSGSFLRLAIRACVPVRQFVKLAPCPFFTRRRENFLCADFSYRICMAVNWSPYS